MKRKVHKGGKVKLKSKWKDEVNVKKRKETEFTYNKNMIEIISCVEYTYL